MSSCPTQNRSCHWKRSEKIQLGTKAKCRTQNAECRMGDLSEALLPFCILHFAFCILHSAFCILHFGSSPHVISKKHRRGRLPPQTIMPADAFEVRGVFRYRHRPAGDRARCDAGANGSCDGVALALVLIGCAYLIAGTVVGVSDTWQGAHESIGRRSLLIF